MKYAAKFINFLRAGETEEELIDVFMTFIAGKCPLRVPAQMLARSTAGGPQTHPAVCILFVDDSMILQIDSDPPICT